MVVRLKLVLEQAEYSALLNLAVGELRNPADQARYILVAELQRLGLLSRDSITQPEDTQQLSDVSVIQHKED